jgi:hypothetical protein
MYRTPSEQQDDSTLAELASLAGQLPDVERALPPELGASFRARVEALLRFASAIVMVQHDVGTVANLVSRHLGPLSWIRTRPLP